MTGLLVVVATGFLLPFIAPQVNRWLNRKVTVAICGSGPVIAFANFVSLADPMSKGESLTFSPHWIRSIGFNLSFFADGLSIL